jgi:hypothetical protein
MFITHRALRDMARRANDEAMVTHHAAIMETIKRSFFEEGVGLWIKELGHPAAWREEVGLRRLRPDAWSYSVFVPIDAGLLDGLEAVQSLYLPPRPRFELYFTLLQPGLTGIYHKYIRVVQQKLTQVTDSLE